MEEKYNTASTFTHCKDDYAVDAETINNIKISIEKISNTTDIEIIHNLFKTFILLVISLLIIVSLVLFTPVEFIIVFLGLTIIPKLSYSVFEQCMKIDIGTMSFKRKDISIIDYAKLKYKYLTNKREFDDIFRNINNAGY